MKKNQHYFNHKPYDFKMYIIQYFVKHRSNINCKLLLDAKHQFMTLNFFRVHRIEVHGSHMNSILFIHNIFCILGSFKFMVPFLKTRTLGFFSY